MTNIRLPAYRSQGVSVLGILAIVLGTIGTVLSLVPCVGLVTGLPLAGLGLLLGVIGLFVSGLGQRSSISLPLIGTAVSLLGLLVSGLWLGLFGVLAAHDAQEEAERQALEAQQFAELQARVEAPQPAADAVGEPVVKDARALKEWAQAFTSGGKAIAVDYFAPAEGAKLPVLLLVHGADGVKLELSQKNYQHIARGMARRGFLVAFVHYFESTGTEFANPITMTLNYGAWFNTVKDAMQAARKQPRADAKQLGLMGVSLGGTLVINLGALNARQVGAVVDVFGGVPDIIANQIQTMPPTLILHGDQDKLVPLADSRKLEKILKQKDLPYELHVYPGAGHGFVGADLRDALDRSAAFLKKHLGDKNN